MLQELNPEQLAAARHGDGPLLIVAGAGTGKTATLVHRVAHLISRGADPRRILLLTFTRRAAGEMLRRAEAVLANSDGDAGGNGRGGASARVWGGTLHAGAARLLRVHAREIGMEPDFTSIDRGDAEDLMSARDRARQGPQARGRGHSWNPSTAGILRVSWPAKAPESQLQHASKRAADAIADRRGRCPVPAAHAACSQSGIRGRGSQR
jgi:superfamily I DNA/RNA helicase